MKEEVLPEVLFSTPEEQMNELKLMIELNRQLLDRMERRLDSIRKVLPATVAEEEEEEEKGERAFEA